MRKWFHYWKGFPKFVWKRAHWTMRVGSVLVFLVFVTPWPVRDFAALLAMPFCYFAYGFYSGRKQLRDEMERDFMEGKPIQLKTCSLTAEGACVEDIVGQ